MDQPTRPDQPTLPELPLRRPAVTPTRPDFRPLPGDSDLGPPQRPGRRRKTRRRLLVWLLLPALTVLLATASGVVVGAVIKKPEVATLDEYKPRLVTALYDRNAQVFQTYSRENRILIDEGELPPLLQQAIIAAEDSNFFRHGGIDLKGILRAASKNIAAGRKKQGASTITMQLARELFLHRERTWARKIEEALLAVELEKRYSKQQILTLYANLVNLSHGNYGMEAASRDYFNKSVRDLTLAEAATLAGIPQRPSHYAIRLRPEEVRKRRNYVLERMAEEGFITRDEYEQTSAEPILVVSRRRETQPGPYFAEEIRRFVASAYGTTALYDRGLRVRTTLDRDVQRAAEEALREGLLRLDHRKGWRGAISHLEDDKLDERRLPSWTGHEPIPDEWYEGIVLESGRQSARVKIDQGIYELTREGIEWTNRRQPSTLLKRGDVAWFRLSTPEEEGEEPILVLEQEPEIEGAVVVVESATGAIRAMVGGWDFERNEFNRITQALRQVGSAFKPFVYGFTAADVLFDGPAVFVGADLQESYSPRNYYRRYYGITTLRKALQSSINVTSVKLLDLVGAEQVVDFARRCGVTSDLPPYPSLALGAASLTPLEVVAAYASFVNQGIYVEPYLIERVLSNDGRVLQEHMPRAHKAMNPQEAYVLTRMLQGVAKNGTAAGGRYGLANVDLDVGGKTGTTNAYTDAWFVGFTPRYTILTWVGYDQKRTIGRAMTGAAAALPIWTTILQRGIEDGWITAGETFPRPPGIVEREVEYTTGLLFGPGAERTIMEVFVAGKEPDKKFDRDWARIMKLPWYLQEPYYLPKEGERMPSQIRDWSLVQDGWQEKDEREEKLKG